MTKEEMAKTLRGFFQTSGNKSCLSDEALDVWFDYFGTVRKEIFIKALKQHGLTSKFQPTPSEIFIQLDAIRIDIFSKLHWQRTIRQILSGEIELEEDETLDYYQEHAWSDDRLSIYEAELETLNKVIDVKYGG